MTSDDAIYVILILVLVVFSVFVIVEWLKITCNIDQFALETHQSSPNALDVSQQQQPKLPDSNNNLLVVKQRQQQQEQKQQKQLLDSQLQNTTINFGNQEPNNDGQLGAGKMMGLDLSRQQITDQDMAIDSVRRLANRTFKLDNSTMEADGPFNPDVVLTEEAAYHHLQQQQQLPLQQQINRQQQVPAGSETAGAGIDGVSMESEDNEEGIETDPNDETASQTYIGKDANSRPDPGQIRLGMIRACGREDRYSSMNSSESVSDLTETTKKFKTPIKSHLARPKQVSNVILSDRRLKLEQANICVRNTP